MGNQAHKIQANVQQHQRLGLVRMLDPPENPDQVQRIQVQRSVISQKCYRDWVEQVSQLDRQANGEVIYLPEKWRYQETGVCGSGGIVYEQMQFEYFPFLLKNQIRNRRNLNQYFQQTQIWYLLYKMVQAQATFQKMHVKIGDFNPKSILLNQNGQIRIISTLSLPNQLDNYSKIVEQILADVYLAPEEMLEKCIEKARYPDHVDPNRAELFCIGITLLEAASLVDCTFIFTRNPLKIQIQKLEKARSTVANKYTGFLSQILKQMTQLDPKKRRSGQNIHKILKPYQNIILQLQPMNWNTIQHSSVKIQAQFKQKIRPGNNINSGDHKSNS